MTVTIQGLRHTEILRDRTDPRFTGRTLRMMSEFGGELNIALSARQVVGLAYLLQETKGTLVMHDHRWTNADQVPAPPVPEPSALITLLGEELRKKIYMELINNTQIDRAAAMGIAIRTMKAYTADCEAEMQRLATPAVL